MAPVVEKQEVGPKKMVTLLSSEKERFEVEEVVVNSFSQTIKASIEDGDPKDKVIPIPNVPTTTLALVVEYCKKHFGKGDKDKELKEWDRKFVKVEMRLLVNLLMAANYLEINSLLDLCCEEFADRIKDYTPEEIRKQFNIENDYTPEEEEQIRQENLWAHQK